MAQQLINIGATANDGTGDPIRTAFNKANLNFTELYAGSGGGGGSLTPGQVNDAVGTYLTTMSSANTGAANASALTADISAAGGKQIRVPPSTSPYLLNPISITGATVNVQFMPGATVSPGVSGPATRIFQMTSCDTLIQGMNFDGLNQIEQCFRADLGTVRIYNSKISNMGSQSFANNAAYGTCGLFFRNVVETYLDDIEFLGVWTALEDNIYANNPGGVRRIFFFGSNFYDFNRIVVKTSGGLGGDDCDHIHFFEDRAIPLTRGQIRNSYLEYNSKTRRCLKYQGGYHNLQATHVVKGSDFVPVAPGAVCANVTAITKANPAQVTATLHGFANGQTVRLTNVVGMTEINGLSAIITVIDGNNFTIAIDSTAFSTYISGGEARRIYRITGITQANPPVVTTAEPHLLPNRQIVIPSGIVGMTELNTNLRGPVITAITKAASAIVTTATAHGLLDDDIVTIQGVSGMTQINGITAFVDFVDATHFGLRAINSTAFSTYTSGGEAQHPMFIQNVTSTTFELRGIDSTAFGAYVSGGEFLLYTDVGIECLNLVDWAGSFKDELKIYGCYIDGSGGQVAVSDAIGPKGRVVMENCTIVSTDQRALRNNPEPSYTPQNTQPIGFLSVPATRDTILRGNKFINCCRGAILQGDNITLENNIFEDPSELAFGIGTTTQKTGAYIRGNVVQTRTPSSLSVNNVATIANNLGVVCENNTLQEQGNTTHATTFISFINASATAEVANNMVFPANTTTKAVGWENITGVNLRLNRDTYTVSTTNATPAVLATIAPGTDIMRILRAYVTGKRTGGSAGTAGDVAGYFITATVQNIAGVASITGQTAVHTAENQAAWDAAFVTFGTSIRLNVTGAANNNITWVARIEVF